MTAIGNQSDTRERSSPSDGARRPYRTKLIEVGLPLEAINEASAREKSIRHGHPSTLHLYWARRPLAACRAVLFSSLVDDPSDDPAYRDRPADEIQARRQTLHDLIAELVVWENSNNERVINRARAEIASSLASFAAEKGEIDLADWPGVVERTAAPDLVNRYLAEVAPPVLDPFAGGGSIPLEAQRLGLRAYASDLNPVAVLINKALIEIPPKFAGQPPVNPETRAKNLGTGGWKGAQGLAEDVRYYGQWIRDEAEKRIGHLYPKVLITPEMVKDRPDLEKYEGQELTVIAWIWARTVASTNPALQGVQVPLISTYWLSKKKGYEHWIDPVISDKDYEFVVRTGDPPSEMKKEISTGTKVGRGCKFECIFSGQPIPEAHVKVEGKEGRIGKRLVAVVCEGGGKRIYLGSKIDSADGDRHAEPINTQGIDAPIANDPRALWCLGYGIDTVSKLFTNRQLAMLSAFSDLVVELRQKIDVDAPGVPKEYAEAISVYLAEAVSKMVVFHNTLAYWRPVGWAALGLGRQALPMSWDFVEMQPFAGAGGDWGQIATDATYRVLSGLPASASGEVHQRDARTHGFQYVCIATDPPYYDNIGYADLSDLFYVWLRRMLEPIYPEIFSTVVTPKSDELIATPYRHEGSREAANKFFEEGLQAAFMEAAQAHVSELPLTSFYAFKQSESEGDGIASTGWETFLTSLVTNGLQITATVPMRTEQTGALKNSVNALASSIVLACRPRPVDAGTCTRGDFVKQLRRNLGSAIADLQRSSIAPVDLRQAAIGPGMAVFSRYKQVVESDGSSMSVREALKLINAELDEILTEQDADYDSITRFAAVWFEQHGFAAGDYGTAQTLATAQNISVESVVEAGLLEAKAGKVRLLRIDELDADWEPETDDTPTVWEMTHHLCRRYDDGGERAAADLVRRLGHHAEAAQQLAFRLFLVCDTRKWSEDAQPYNRLGTAWNDLVRLALDPTAASRGLSRAEESAESEEEGLYADD